MKKNIFLIVAPSGAGKTTLATALEKQHNLKSIQSYTTRPPRYEGEIGHIFVTENEFSKLQDIVAYTEFCGYKYCATKEQVENNDLYAIDPYGVDFFKKAYHGSKDVKVIYISSPLHIRYERMKDRGDSYSMALERVCNDIMDFRGFEEKADFIVENNDDTYFSNVINKTWEYIRSVTVEDFDE